MRVIMSVFRHSRHKRAKADADQGAQSTERADYKTRSPETGASMITTAALARGRPMIEIKPMSETADRGTLNRPG